MNHDFVNLPASEASPLNTTALPAMIPGHGADRDHLFRFFRPGEKAYVFIDGSNTYSAVKKLQFRIDFGRMRDLFDEYLLLQRMYYFTALPQADVSSPLRRQVDWMKYHGYTVITKFTKEYTTNDAERLIKGNVDVELTVAALEVCHHVDHIILFTGDGDFCALVEALQKRGCRVTAVSTHKTSPPHASDDLRKQVDHFIDLNALQPYICRQQVSREHIDGDEGEDGGRSPPIF